MSEQPITTSIDDLVKYLNEHGETESSVLASELKVGENIINTWAEVLEKAQITKINYKMGKMFVSPMVITKESVEAAKKTVELKKDVAETELLTQVSMINQVNARLDEFKRFVSGAESTFKTKAGSIKEAIDEIDKLNARVDGSYKKLKDKKVYIDTLSSNIDKETLKLEEKSKSAEGISGRDSDSKRVIADIRSKLDDSETRLRDLRVNFNSALEEERKGSNDMLDGIRSENSKLREMLKQQEKEVQDYASFLESYKKESDAAKRQIIKERNKMLDDIARSGDETRKVFRDADKRVADTKKMLAEMKSQFGGYSELSDKLNNIKTSIDEIEKKKGALQKDFDALGDQLRVLSTLEQSRVAEKTVKMGQVNQKIADAAKRVDEIASETEAVKNGIDDMIK